MISERLWQRLFGRSPAAIGEPLVLSSQPYTIVGVAGAEFQFPSERTDSWIPAAFARAQNPRCCGFRMIGRLKPDETIAAAATEADGLAKSLAATVPARAGSVRATVVSLRDQIAGPVRPALLVLFTAVGLTLVVACVNVTNLLLAHRAGRAREMAIRSALGASRARLIAHAVIDSAVLAAAGTASGVAVAIAFVAVVRHLEPAMIPRLDAVRVDLPVLAFSADLAAVVAICTSLVPALQSANAADLLRSGATAGAPHGRRVMRLLCVTEVAVSLVLVVGATLLSRSVVRLMQSNPGVTTDHVITASLNLAFERRLPDAEALARVERVIERVGAVPGIRAIGVGTALPPGASRLRLTLRRAGDAVDYQAAGVAATPGYFDALGIKLVKGRLFTAADDLAHPPVMIMSADTARRFFGDSDPIGRTLTLPFSRNGVNGSEEMTLVGVIANVKYSGLDRAPDDAVYRPFAQQVWMAPYLVARTSGDPRRFAEAVRREIAAVDRGIVVADVTPLGAIVSAATAQPRVRAIVFASIAGLALAMAALGLYGVVASSVAQRNREIGIRMALGADGDDVMTMVLREGARVAALGIAVGLAASCLATRALTGLLYGTAPTDPASFGLASAGLFGVMLVASYVPARRAMKVDPNVVLRYE